GGHLEGRRRDRVAHPGRAREAARGADGARHRAPALDHRERRSHPRPAQGRAARAGNAPPAARPRRHLRAPLPHAVRRGAAGAGARCSAAMTRLRACGGVAARGPAAAPGPRLTRAALAVTSPRWLQARAEPAGVASAGPLAALRGARWLAFLVLLSGCGTSGYLLRAGWSEARLLLRRQPITQVLARADLPPGLRERLELVLAVRGFAASRLGLRVGDSYTTFAEVPSHSTVYVLPAARR